MKTKSIIRQLEIKADYYEGENYHGPAALLREFAAELRHRSAPEELDPIAKILAKKVLNFSGW